MPPAPLDCFRVEDLDAALGRFPDLNFHIVHAGVTFLEQTCALMARHRNLYANLESSFSYALRKPRVFAEVLGEMLLAAGHRQLLYGSGANLVHPRPLIEAFAIFEMPSDLIDDRGYPALTWDVKAAILGENALRIHGLSAPDARAGIDGDPFERIKENGFARPWSLVAQRAQTADGR